VRHQSGTIQSASELLGCADNGDRHGLDAFSPTVDVVLDRNIRLRALAGRHGGIASRGQDPQPLTDVAEAFEDGASSELQQILAAGDAQARQEVDGGRSPISHRRQHASQSAGQTDP